MLIFLYSSGVWIGETKQILWPQVNLKAKEMHLESFQTKNKSGRTAPLSEELVGLLKKRFRTNDGPVFDTRNLRKEWDKATSAAKLPGILIHDLRRSAVRNMMKAGIRESIAMKISGHKTANVFRRYDIVDSSDLHAAMDAVSKMYASEVKK